MVFANLCDDARFPTTRHSGLEWVVSEHNLQFGVFGVLERVRRRPFPIEIGESGSDLSRRVIAVLSEETTEAVQKPGPGATLSDISAGGSCPVVIPNSFVAVCLFDPLQFGSDGVERLFPRDLHPFILATLSRAFHRVLNPVGGVDALSLVAATDARNVAEIVEFVAACVVRQYPNDFSVLNLKAKRTSRLAVNQASVPDRSIYVDPACAVWH